MAVVADEGAREEASKSGVTEPAGDAPPAPAATEDPTPRAGSGEAATPKRPGPAQGIAAAITAWSTASLTFLKAVLALVAAVLLLLAAGRILWRSYGQKQVTIEVDPAVTKLFERVGVDFDLRSMLVAAVDQKLEAVQTIVKVQDLVIVDGEQPIDVKAVGVDMKSDDLRSVVQSILGPPPAYHVRLGVSCSDGACATPADGAAKSSSALPREIGLVIDMKGRASDERIVRHITWPNAGLRHELRAAIDDLADRILLKVNRQAASVLFMNVGAQIEFREDGIDYESRAAAAAFDKGPHDGCLARNVYATSLWVLGDPESAALILEQAGRDKDATTRCRVHSATNLSVVRTSQAFGEPDPTTARARFEQASSALDSLSGMALAESERLRVAAFRIELELVRVGEALRQAAGPSAAEEARSAYRRVSELVIRAEKDLPPVADHLFGHQIIEQAVAIVGRPSAIDAAPERVSSALKLLRMVDHCLTDASAPRRLLLARGSLEQVLAITLHEAMRAPAALQAAIQRALQQDGAGVFPIGVPPAEQWWQAKVAALVSFQAATKTQAFPFPLERASEIEPLADAADVFFLFDDSTEDAPTFYAKAVQAFVEHDMPSSDTHLIALTVAKWAIWSVRHQRCVGPLAEPPSPVLSALGLKGGQGLCSFAAARSHQTTMNPRGLWGIIQKQAQEAVQSCASPPAAGEPPDAIDRNGAILQCLQERFRAWQVQGPFDSSAAVDREIEAAGP